MVKLRVVENSPSVFYISDVCQPEKMQMKTLHVIVYSSIKITNQ